VGATWIAALRELSDSLLRDATLRHQSVRAGAVLGFLPDKELIGIGAIGHKVSSAVEASPPQPCTAQGLSKENTA